VSRIREVVEKGRSKSRLEEILERDKELKAAELERLKLERLVEEERRRLEEMRAGKPVSEAKETGLEEFGLTINTVRELAKLPDEERNRVIQTWAMIRSADKVQSGILLPLLIGFARANPNASQTSMVEFAKIMAEQLKTGFDMAKKAQPPQPSVTYDPVKLIETMATVWSQRLEKPLQEIVERLQPQPSPFERILMDPDLFERAKALGWFSMRPPEKQTPPEVALEIEKFKTERDIKLKELELQIERMRQEHQRWIAQQQFQIQSEQRRWEAVKDLMKGPFGQVVTTLGGAAAAKIRGEEMPPKPIQVDCPQCGGTFYTSSDAKLVTCPYCNTKLKAVGGAEGGQQEPSKPAEAG